MNLSPMPQPYKLGTQAEFQEISIPLLTTDVMTAADASSSV
jgi:hypothetical protein